MLLINIQPVLHKYTMKYLNMVLNSNHQKRKHQNSDKLLFHLGGSPVIYTYLCLLDAVNPFSCTYTRTYTYMNMYIAPTQIDMSITYNTDTIHECSTYDRWWWCVYIYIYTVIYMMHVLNTYAHNVANPTIKLSHQLTMLQGHLHRPKKPYTQFYKPLLGMVNYRYPIYNDLCFSDCLNIQKN